VVTNDKYNGSDLGQFVLVVSDYARMYVCMYAHFIRIIFLKYT